MPCLGRRTELPDFLVGHSAMRGESSFGSLFFGKFLFCSVAKPFANNKNNRIFHTMKRDTLHYTTTLDRQLDVLVSHNFRGLIDLHILQVRTLVEVSSDLVSSFNK